MAKGGSINLTINGLGDNNSGESADVARAVDRFIPGIWFLRVGLHGVKSLRPSSPLSLHAEGTETRLSPTSLAQDMFDATNTESTLQNWLDRLADLAALRGDEHVLAEALAQLTAKAGFSCYAYLYIRPGHTIASSNYPAEWRSIYFNRKFETLDPIVRRAKSLKRVFTWSGEDERRRQSKKERAFFDRAADFGIRSGITIPLKAANGSTSLFTLASDQTNFDPEQDIDPVAAAGAVGQLHTRMCLLSLTPDGQHPPWLDPKEAAYLNWIAVGKTMEEAADLEGVKYNSVKSKLEETRKRLGVHTMPHLVAIAIRAGLI